MSTRPHSGGPARDPQITAAVAHYLTHHKTPGKRSPYCSLKDTANQFNVKYGSIVGLIQRQKVKDVAK